MCKICVPIEFSYVLLPLMLLSPRLRGLTEVSCFLLQNTQQGLGTFQDLYSRGKKLYEAA